MELSKEDIEFIKNLSHEMKTQDNRCTAQPYALVLREEVTRIVPDGYSDELECYWDECVYANFDEFMEEFKEYHKDYNKHNYQLGEILGTEDFYQVKQCLYISDYDINIQYVTTEQEIKENNVNFFLTEKAYHEYIRRNGHNLTNPDSYGIHLFRNEEMKRLYEIIHKLADAVQQN